MLVTGGAGYIGSHFVALLEDRGVPYVVIDNLCRSTGGFVPANRLIRADVGDRAAVIDVVRRHDIASAVHFAAFAYVGESIASPDIYYENNVVQTYRFVSALREAGVRRMVFSSTCATYGSPTDDMPIRETLEQRPINPYGRSKLIVEQILRDFATAYGMSFAFLRYFNAAGCSERHMLYEDHDPETHAIPLAIRATLGGEAFIVFGDDFDTPDGTCVRDYIHVDDLAEAHLLALQRLDQEGEVLALNLGTGRGSSVREVLDSVARVTGRPVPHRIGRRRAGDPPFLVADGGLASSLLSWHPKYRKLDSIIRTAFEGAMRARARENVS